MLEAIIKHLRQNKYGVSNVIVAMRARYAKPSPYSGHSCQCGALELPNEPV